MLCDVNLCTRRSHTVDIIFTQREGNSELRLLCYGNGLSDKIAFQCPAIIHFIVQIIRPHYCVFNSADMRTVREKETSFNVM